jgi:opacity protein-like surface antigen
MLKNVPVLSAAVLLFSYLTCAQENRYDVSLGATAVFSKKSTGNATELVPTDSGAFLATARMRFTNHSSLALNYARTKNSQIYNTTPFTYRVPVTISEFSGAYVFSFMQSERLEPFVFGGAAGLSFYATSSYADTTTQAPIGETRQTQPALLYGAGADYRVWHRIAVRLQYRGLFYKAPDFKGPNFFTGARGHLAEPGVGVVLKF